MKKIFYIILLFSFYFNVSAVELDLYSQNAVLYNLDENTVLYEKNKDEKIAIASMTKIMSAIVALENIENLDEKVTLTSEDFQGLKELNASVAGFYIGQKLTFRDLLYGLMLPSGADAAQALARNIGDTQENFVDMMNKKAEELNLKNTHFTNESGFDDIEHYSTVDEVATILKYALQNADFKEIITTSNYTTSDGLVSMQSSVSGYINKYNLELDYLQGGKTGTTKNAGRCLASIATSNGTNYLLVTARATQNERTSNIIDAKTIYEYFINNYQNQTIVEKDDIILTLDTEYSKDENVNFYAEEDIVKFLANDFNKEDLEYRYDGIKKIDPTMGEGIHLGILKIKYNDEIIMTKDIYLEKVIPFSFLGYLSYYHTYVVGGIILCLVVIVSLIVIKRHRRR